MSGRGVPTREARWATLLRKGRGTYVLGHWLQSLEAPERGAAELTNLPQYIFVNGNVPEPAPGRQAAVGDRYMQNALTLEVGRTDTARLGQWDRRAGTSGGDLNAASPFCRLQIGPKLPVSCKAPTSFVSATPNSRVATNINAVRRPGAVKEATSTRSLSVPPASVARVTSAGQD